MKNDGVRRTADVRFGQKSFVAHPFTKEKTVYYFGGAYDSVRCKERSTLRNKIIFRGMQSVCTKRTTQF